MPIFYNPKIIFIHIPRTGGTAFLAKIGETNSRFPDYTPSNSSHYNHPFTHKTYLHYKKDLKEKINDYKLMTIVRNPYERMVSYYKMHLIGTNLLQIQRQNKFDSYDKEYNFYLKKMFIEKKFTLIENVSSLIIPEICHLTQTDYLINEDNVIEKKIEVYKLEDFKKNLPEINITKFDVDFKLFYKSKENIEIIKNYFYNDFINFNYSFNLPE